MKAMVRPWIVLVLVLSACGSDTAGPPAGPRDSLLSDSALHVPVPAGAPALDAGWASWIREHHHPVRSLTSTDDFSDLQFLKPLIGNRRLVQLGESSHGAREFNQAKVRLIQFLHQEMGFDVVAFESGLAECFHANLGLRETSSATTLRNCLFAVWYTDEVRQLFAYMREPHARPLTLAGFDVQPSGNLPRAQGPRMLREVLTPIDAALGQQIMFYDSIFVAHLVHPEIEGILESYGDSMIARHHRAIQLIQDNAAAIRSRYPNQPDMALVAAQIARNQIRMINMQRVEEHERFLHRDTGMAANITFLLQELFPGRKIVVWAHNGHVRHDAPAIPFTSSLVMGTELAGRHREELYTVGFYMGSGVSAANNRAPVPVVQPPDNGVEALMMRAERRFSFVDMLHAPEVPGSAWMRQPIGALSWGAQPYTMVPRNQYDAIFYVHRTNMPAYLP